MVSRRDPYGLDGYLADPQLRAKEQRDRNRLMFEMALRQQNKQADPQQAMQSERLQSGERQSALQSALQRVLQSERLQSGERSQGNQIAANRAMQSERLQSTERLDANRLANQLVSQRERFAGQKDLAQQSSDLELARRKAALESALNVARNARSLR
jgi:hypothetical protein